MSKNPKYLAASGAKLENERLNDSLHIYVDGSFSPDTKTGGWAFVVYRNGIQSTSSSGRVDAQGNGQMEVLALQQALEWIVGSAIDEQVVVWCDSHYVVDGCNRLLKFWRTNGWKRVTANPRQRKRSIPDRELWRSVDHSLARHTSTTIMWCKGHSENTGNEQADKLASIQSL